MKKTFILISFLVASMATTALAATKEVAAGESLTSETKVIAKFSKGVGAKIVSSATAFSAATKHLNGTKQFATSSVDPKLYWTTQDAGTAIPAVGLTNSDTSDFTGWSAL